jgi:hypothetical protein
MIRALLAASVLVVGISNASARDKRHRVATYEPRIICGQTGCSEIKPGCSGELRRTGRSVVAVVWCDKK